MRAAVWVLLGGLGVSVWTGLGVAWAPGHVIPDVAVIVVFFLGMRLGPVPLCVAALSLGYFVGRQALAPGGLHEAALIGCAVGVYRMSGSFVGGGSLFFGVAAAVVAVLYHSLLFVMVSLVWGEASFSSWATAALIPGAVATGILGALAYRPMSWLDQRLTPKHREGLLWR